MKKIIKNNRGMTIIELVVVLAIFAVVSSVVLFNYGGFQVKVDIKNLASDIGLKIVEAQKSSLNGKLPPLAQQTLIPNPTTWKPSYGFYVDRASDNKSFYYFTDTDQDGEFNDTSCSGSGECLEKITITRQNSISNLEVFYQVGGSETLNDVTVTFKRPDSKANIRSSTTFTSTVSYVTITISAPNAATATIKLYPSGRIQVN